MTYPPAGRGSDACPVCGHTEDDHFLSPADETRDGWAHCTIGTGATACACWRDWPRLPAEPSGRAVAHDLPAITAPPLHDWRYVVRTVGKALIAIGLLLAGFVAYQLWGTGIEARRAQSQLEDEFEALLAAASPTPTAASTSTVATPSSPPDTLPPVAEPIVAEPIVAEPIVAEPIVAEPIVAEPIVEGDPIARLEIPAIDVDVVVVAGVSVADLRRGPGHYPDTPLPGQFGNAAIAGHRTTYGQPFHDVDDLEPGDEIVVTTVTGRFVYAVTGTEIVDDDATYVVATTNPDIAELTLTSCHPKWSARQRIIVHSLLVADQSAPVGAPTIGHSGGVTPTTTTTTATTATSTTTATTATATLPTTSAAPATSIAPGAGSTFTTPSADAFSDGWFHDRSAIPQVALWALAVSAVAIGAHVLGRRVRRLVGIAAGTVPFLIALYFFYQNVNRLLPPSL